MQQVPGIASLTRIDNFDSSERLPFRGPVKKCATSSRPMKTYDRDRAATAEQRNPRYDNPQRPCRNTL